ncbi:MAG: type II toxin-antitoxin system Phd/YefM family antitoxin [bacterium]
MKASILDLRRRMGDILHALDQNETVTLLHRGKPKGIIVPAAARKSRASSVREHPAFGIWKNRDDMRDVKQFARTLRKGRIHAV